jgi:hypothetical protein
LRGQGSNQEKATPVGAPSGHPALQVREGSGSLDARPCIQRTAHIVCALRVTFLRTLAAPQALLGGILPQKQECSLPLRQAVPEWTKKKDRERKVVRCGKKSGYEPSDLFGKSRANAGARELLAWTGPFASEIENYAERPSQLDMARGGRDGDRRRTRVDCRGRPGTGKTFATSAGSSL